MKPELRTLLFCVTLLIVAPALYAVGEWLGGIVAAVALPAVAVLGTLAYARAGERQAASPGDVDAVTTAAPPPKERETHGAPQAPGAPPLPPTASGSPTA
jgi:hypothetical protein